jgi:predicted lipoprotein
VIDPTARPNVEKLHLEVRALRQIIAQRLAPALGFEVGFNALDGD